MKLMCAVLLMAMTVAAFAQRTPRRSNRSMPAGMSRQIEQGIKLKVLKLANTIPVLASQEVHSLSRQELIELHQILKQAKMILKDTTIDNDPLPRLSVVCADDFDINLYHQTFAGMKTLGTSELGYWTNDSIAFADRWTKKYPCDYAAEYEDKIIQLKDFALKKLGYWTNDAIQYAKTNVDKLCLDQDYEAMFDQHLNFAKRQLGYWNNDAIKYARGKVEGQMLSCEAIGIF